MRTSIHISLLSIGLIMSSCGQNEPQVVKETVEVQTISQQEKAEKQALADSISNIAQAILLQNVSHAMKAGGSINAIEFCSVEAVPLLDSVSKANKVKVERVTDKNRNPDNYLKTQDDKTAWANFKSSFFKSQKPIPYLQEQNNTFVYYKPIAMTKPACLKCHGAPEQDIDAETARKINEKYPNDLATNYKMGDFRGMWKVTFER